MSLYPFHWFSLRIGNGKDLGRNKTTFSKANVPEADKQSIKRYSRHNFDPFFYLTTSQKSLSITRSLSNSLQLSRAVSVAFCLSFRFTVHYSLFSTPNFSHYQGATLRSLGSVQPLSLSHHSSFLFLFPPLSLLVSPLWFQCYFPHHLFYDKHVHFQNPGDFISSGQIISYCTV